MTGSRFQTCLWFEADAEEAVAHYVAAFPRSQVLDTTRYPGGGRMPEGTVLSIAFRLDGQDFVAINGGVRFAVTPAVSTLVLCDTQDEIDTLWSRLSADPAREQCGWLADRWGYAWQIVPRRLLALMREGSAAQRRSLVEVMLTMKKLDLAALEAAHANPTHA